MLIQHEIKSMTDDELIEAQHNYMDVRMAGMMTSDDIDNCNLIMDEEDRRKKVADNG